MSGVAQKIYRTSRLLALSSKTFPAGKKIQPGPPAFGIWRSAHARRGKSANKWIPPHYDELPVPKGDWDKWYKRNNEKYNRHLAIGLGFFLFTVFVMSQTIDFNFSPPPLDDEDDMCKKTAPKCVT